MENDNVIFKILLAVSVLANVYFVTSNKSYTERITYWKTKYDTLLDDVQNNEATIMSQEQYIKDLEEALKELVELLERGNN